MWVLFPVHTYLRSPSLQLNHTRTQLTILHHTHTTNHFPPHIPSHTFHHTHSIDALNKYPGHLEAVLGAVKEMVEEGLVLNVGLSNVSLSTLKRARNILPIATVRVKEPLYYSSVSEIFTLRIEKLHLAET